MSISVENLTMKLYKIDFKQKNKSPSYVDPDGRLRMDTWNLSLGY